VPAFRVKLGANDLNCVDQKRIVAELLLGEVRNEKKKTKTNKKTAMKS